MKTLFFGGFNHFTTAFAGKLAKNGIDIAVYNSDKVKPKLDFRYSKYTSSSEFASRVFENFRPNILVVSAAYDDRNFLGDLENVMSAAVNSNVERIIYLSSTAVYGPQKDREYLPVEDDTINPKSKRSLLFAAGEDICCRFGKANDTPVTSLRLASVYGVGSKGAELNVMVRDLIDGKKMEIPENAKISAFSMDDAAEIFMHIFDTAFEDVYNFTAKEALSASELRDTLIESVPEAKENLHISEHGVFEYMTADSTRLGKQYQWRERHSFSDELPKIAAQEREALTEEKKKTERKAQREKGENSYFGIITRLIETVLLFVLVVYLTLIQSSVPLIHNVDFVVIYLVIVAITMSLRQSATALVLSLGLLVWQQIQMGYDPFTAIINTDTLLMAAEYCIVSIAVSYVIQRLKIKNQLLQLEIDEKERELGELEEFSQDNLNSRHFFEDQILGYDLSLPRVISMTSSLDSLEPSRIFPETLAIMSESIGVDDVAVYFIGSKGGRMRLSHAKTEAATMLGQSPLMDDYPDMISALEQGDVYMNLDMKKGYPSMASGVRRDGKLMFVFVLSNLPFRKMCLDTSNLLKAITELVSAALVRAYKYEETTAAERYIAGTSVLNAAAFKSLCEAHFAREGMMNGVLCRVNAGNKSIEELGSEVQFFTRENDYIGLGEDGELMVLLSGTSEEGYHVFERRLAEKGISAVLVKGEA